MQECLVSFGPPPRERRGNTRWIFPGSSEFVWTEQPTKRSSVTDKPFAMAVQPPTESLDHSSLLTDPSSSTSHATPVARKLAQLGLSSTEEDTDEDSTEQLTRAFLDPKRQQDNGAYLEHFQVHWKRQPDLSTLLPSGPLPQTTSLRFIHAGLSGQIVGSREVITHEQPSNASRKSQLEQQKLQANQRNRMNFVRGQTGGQMFMPGGLNDEDLQLTVDDVEASTSTSQGEELQKEMGQLKEAISGWGRGLRTKPPGFHRGFQAAKQDDDDEEEDANEAADDDSADPSKGLVPAPAYQPSLSKPSLTVSGQPQSEEPDPERTELDDLLPTDRPQIGEDAGAKARSSLNDAAADKREWAHVVDATKRLANFNELVPNMAHKVSFQSTD